MNDIPNYKTYTLEELNDAFSHINKELYPERVKLIEGEIIQRKKYGNDFRNWPEEQQPETKRNLLLELSNGLVKENPTFESIESAVISLEHSNNDFIILKTNDYKYIKAVKGFNERYTLIYQDGSDEVYISKIKTLSKEFITKLIKEYAKTDGNWKVMIHWKLLAEDFSYHNKRFHRFWHVLIFALLSLIISIKLNSQSIIKDLVAYHISISKLFFCIMLFCVYLNREEILNLNKLCTIQKKWAIIIIIVFIMSIIILFTFDY